MASRFSAQRACQRAARLVRAGKLVRQCGKRSQRAAFAARFTRASAAKCGELTARRLAWTSLSVRQKPEQEKPCITRSERLCSPWSPWASPLARRVSRAPRETQGTQQEELGAAEGPPAAPQAEQAPPPDGPRRRGPPSPERLLQKLDTDGNGNVERAEIPQFLQGADTNSDGKLTVDELKAHHEKMRAEHFARKDKNHDGFLTQDEVDERHWSMLSVADANKDGKLTQAELDQAHADGKLPKMMGHHRGRHGPMPPAALLEKFDSNKNGTLELSELPEHKRERLGAADKNGDQRLTVDELRSFFEAHRPPPGAHFDGPPPGPPPAGAPR